MRPTDLLYHAHSGLRYLVLLAALASLVAALLGGRRSQPGAVLARLYRGYAWLVAAQAALGLVLLFLRPFYPRLAWHAALMLAAVGVTHGLGRFGRAAPRRLAAGAALSLLLIIVGILAIRPRLL